MLPKSIRRSFLAFIAPWALMVAFGLVLSGCAFLGGALGMGWPSLVLAIALALAACGGGGGGGGSSDAGPDAPTSETPTTFPAPATVTPLANLEDLAAGGGVLGGTITGPASNARMGDGAAFIGDVNGDGYDDLYVNRDDGSYVRGYVILGSATGIPESVDLDGLDGSNGFLVNGQSESVWRQAAAAAGDVNGDGFGDFLIADSVYSANAGQVWVVFGQAGFGSSINLQSLGSGGFTFTNTAGQFGAAVAGGGDLDGDGYDDIAIGAPYSNSDAGAAYVIRGSSAFTSPIDIAALSMPTGFTISNGTSHFLAGYSLSLAGDVNGDGRDDLAVAACGGEYGYVTGGAAYVLFGKAALANVNLAAIPEGDGAAIENSAYDFWFGQSVALGDFNGDGHADVAVGSPIAYSQMGMVAVVFGTASMPATVDVAGIGPANGFLLYGGAAAARVGGSATAAGDVNGDGVADLLIGAYYHGSPSGNGSAYVVFGRPSGFSEPVMVESMASSAGFRMLGAGNSWAGRVVSGGGDVDGDGYDDLLVAAPNFSSNTGRTYVVKGGNFTGSVTQGGTVESETIIGQPDAADSLLAGAGDDILKGQGGADILLGAAGVDGFEVTDNLFRRIDGGPGLNGLHLKGTATWDLTKNPARLRRIQGLEIDAGATLKLNLQSVRHMARAGEANALTIGGPAGSTVSLADTWTAGGDVTFEGITFHQYNRGAYWLNVQDGVAVTQP